MDIDLKQMRELMRAMKQLGMSELELEQDGARADRAMAEAIAVVEAVGVADDYRAFLESLGRGDEPADRPE